MSVAAVVLAGGSGSRLGADRNKVLLTLGGESLLRRSVRTATLVRGVAVVVVVVRAGDEPDLDGDWPVPVETAPGGGTRHASEWSALQHLRPRIGSGEVDGVAIHDAARPLASVALWDTVVSAAREHGGALPARPAVSVVRRDGGPVPDLVTVQTPQAFRAVPLLEAYAAAERDGFTGTDTASCVTAYSEVRLRAVDGEVANLKVTWAEDLPLAERLLRRR
jgi:2-C-methyl-D-erythritol 4-phosphate cytidylyltransferase